MSDTYDQNKLLQRFKAKPKGVVHELRMREFLEQRLKTRQLKKKEDNDVKEETNSGSA